MRITHTLVEVLLVATIEANLLTGFEPGIDSRITNTVVNKFTGDINKPLDGNVNSDYFLT
jgi:hypothetical protein